MGTTSQYARASWLASASILAIRGSPRGELPLEPEGPTLLLVLVQVHVVKYKFGAGKTPILEPYCVFRTTLVQNDS